MSKEGGAAVVGIAGVAVAMPLVIAGGALAEALAAIDALVEDEGLVLLLQGLQRTDVEKRNH